MGNILSQYYTGSDSRLTRPYHSFKSPTTQTAITDWLQKLNRNDPDTNRIKSEIVTYAAKKLQHGKRSVYEDKTGCDVLLNLADKVNSGRNSPVAKKLIALIFEVILEKSPYPPHHSELKINGNALSDSFVRQYENTLFNYYKLPDLTSRRVRQHLAFKAAEILPGDLTSKRQTLTHAPDGAVMITPVTSDRSDTFFVSVKQNGGVRHHVLTAKNGDIDAEMKERFGPDIFPPQLIPLKNLIDDITGGKLTAVAVRRKLQAMAPLIDTLKPLFENPEGDVYRRNLIGADYLVRYDFLMHRYSRNTAAAHISEVSFMTKEMNRRDRTVFQNSDILKYLAASSAMPANSYIRCNHEDGSVIYAVKNRTGQITIYHCRLDKPDQLKRTLQVLKKCVPYRLEPFDTLHTIGRETLKLTAKFNKLKTAFDIAKFRDFSARLQTLSDTLKNLTGLSITGQLQQDSRIYLTSTGLDLTVYNAFTAPFSVVFSRSLPDGRHVKAQLPVLPKLTSILETLNKLRTEMTGEAFLAVRYDYVRSYQERQLAGLEQDIIRAYNRETSRNASTERLRDIPGYCPEWLAISDGFNWLGRTAPKEIETLMSSRDVPAGSYLFCPVEPAEAKGEKGLVLACAKHQNGRLESVIGTLHQFLQYKKLIWKDLSPYQFQASKNNLEISGMLQKAETLPLNPLKEMLRRIEENLVSGISADFPARPVLIFSENGLEQQFYDEGEIRRFQKNIGTGMFLSPTTRGAVFKYIPAKDIHDAMHNQYLALKEKAEYMETIEKDPGFSEIAFNDEQVTASLQDTAMGSYLITRHKDHYILSLNLGTTITHSDLRPVKKDVETLNRCKTTYSWQPSPFTDATLSPYTNAEKKEAELSPGDQLCKELTGSVNGRIPRKPVQIIPFHSVNDLEEAKKEFDRNAPPRSFQIITFIKEGRKQYGILIKRLMNNKGFISFMPVTNQEELLQPVQNLLEQGYASPSSRLKAEEEVMRNSSRKTFLATPLKEGYDMHRKLNEYIQYRNERLLNRDF